MYQYERQFIYLLTAVISINTLTCGLVSLQYNNLTKTAKQIKLKLIFKSQ